MKNYFLFILFFSLGICEVVLAQTDIISTGRLSIKASGFKNAKGQAILELFRKDDAIPSQPFKTIKAPILNLESEFTLEGLPYSDYAAIIYHDENSNNILDHCWGLPCEPMGFSKHWKLTMFSGMPTFQKLKFTFAPYNNNYKIFLKD
jgi:uncharacterized protein (DUF2141 family)